MVLSFPILADYAYITDGNIRIFATHGHKFGQDNPPPLSYGDILLTGHTHIPAFIPFGCGNVYINPGSCAIPKENSEKYPLLFFTLTVSSLITLMRFSPSVSKVSIFLSLKVSIMKTFDKK